MNTSGDSRRAHVLVALGLVVLTFAIYAQVRRHDFVDFDDMVLIVHHPLHRAGLSVDSVVSAFTTPYHLNWVPVTSLSLQLDHALWGARAGPTLLVNAALHALASLLVFRVFAGMTGAMWRSAFLAAVFAVHPLHVESVAWASERKDVLSGVFWMLTLWAYAGWTRRGGAARYALVSCVYALGLMSKPSLMTLPFALLLLDDWPLGRLRAAGARWPEARALRRAVVEKLPLFALAAVAGAVAWRVQSGVGQLAYGERLGPAVQAWNALDSYGQYLLDSVWPAGLAAFYPHPEAGVPTWRALAAGAFLAAFTALAVRVSATRRYVLVGWLWFLGTLVPVIGFVQAFLQARADRYMYIPLLGLALIVAWGVPDLVGRGRARRRALAGAAGAALAALAVTAWVQVRHWRDSVSLFSHAVAVTEDNGYALHRLGVALLAEERVDEAARAYEELFRVEPAFARGRFEIASALERAGDREAAIEHFRRGVALAPKFAEGRGYLGLALMRSGRPAEAEPHLAFALEQYPTSVELRVGMARVAEAQGRPAEAIEHYRAALRTRPEPEAMRGLAWLLATAPDPALRDPAEALRRIEPLARDARPGGPRILDTLAAAYAAAGRFESAVATAARAERLAREAGDAAGADAIGKRLSLYRTGRPYVQPPRD